MTRRRARSGELPARPRLRFTRHALSAMRRRDVAPSEVSLAVDEPDCVYQDGPRWVHQRRRLAVVLDREQWTVQTVLLRTGPGERRRWDDADMRCRELLPNRGE